MIMELIVAFVQCIQFENETNVAIKVACVAALDFHNIKNLKWANEIIGFRSNVKMSDLLSNELF